MSSLIHKRIAPLILSLVSRGLTLDLKTMEQCKKMAQEFMTSQLVKWLIAFEYHGAVLGASWELGFQPTTKTDNSGKYKILITLSVSGSSIFGSSITTCSQEVIKRQRFHYAIEVEQREFLKIISLDKKNQPLKINYNGACLTRYGQYLIFPGVRIPLPLNLRICLKLNHETRRRFIDLIREINSEEFRTIARVESNLQKLKLSAFG